LLAAKYIDLAMLSAQKKLVAPQQALKLIISTLLLAILDILAELFVCAAITEATLVPCVKLSLG
jgi:hypothetical protein